MRKIKYLVLILMLLILPAHKVKADALPRNNSNYCKYTLTDPYSKKNINFFVIPYIEFGSDFQGEKKETTVIEGYGVAGFEFNLKEYEYLIESISMPSINMSFETDYLFNKLITLDSQKKINRCPDICYTMSNYKVRIIPKGTVKISDNASFIVDGNTNCPGESDYFSDLNVRATGTISNEYSDSKSINNTNNDGLLSNCNGIISTEALNIIRRVMNYIQFLVPGLLLVMISVDFLTATIAKDDKKMRESYNRAVKRMIAGICVIIMPVFVKILFNIPVIKETLESSGIVDDPMCDKATGANVLKIKVEISPKQYTKNDVKIKLTNTMGEYHYVSINGKVLNSTTDSDNRKTAEYEVSDNGIYEFEFYDSNSELILIKKVDIKNISTKMPGGKCEINIEANQITASATSDNSIKSYSYKINDGEYSKPALVRTYKSQTEIKSASMKIRDKVDNEVEIICEKQAEKAKEGNLEVFFITVGWGDSIVIRSASQVIVIDGGLYSYGSTTVNFIKALGITKIDAYIASHFDGDHIGATNAIFKAFPVTQAYVPSPKITNTDNSHLKALKASNAKQMKIGDVIDFGKEFYIEVVGAPKLSDSCKKGHHCGNMDSINFLLHHGEITFFFTGDYVWSNELLKKYPASTFKANVLKQPHHGMHDYISKSMLKAVNPSYIVMTSNNGSVRSANMIKWQEESGAELHWTGATKSGNMAFISDGKKLKFDKKVKASKYKR